MAPKKKKKRSARKPAKRSTTVTTQKESVPPFLSKLWLLVDDKSTDACIRWGEDGNSFIVIDQITFASAVLPYFFRHNNMASFYRQLSSYCFRRKFNLYGGALLTDRDDIEFQHPYFLKGKPDQLQLIKRRVRGVSNKDETKLKPTEVGEVLSDEQEMKVKQENITPQSEVTKRPCETVRNDFTENVHVLEDDGSVFEELLVSSANEASQEVTGHPTPPLSTQTDGGLLADRGHPSTVPQAVSVTRATKRTTSSGCAQASPQKFRSYEERMVELAEEQHRLTLQHMQREHELRMDILAIQKLTEEKKLEAAMASLSKKLNGCSSASIYDTTL